MSRYTVRVKGIKKPGSCDAAEFSFTVEGTTEADAKKNAIDQAEVERPGFQEYIVKDIRELN